jgi:hypothetical protein
MPCPSVCRIPRRAAHICRDLDEMMKGTTMPEVKWLDKPQDHDYPAAGDYLALIADPQAVTALTDKVRAGSIVHKKAKDILRAARLPLLPVDNPHVAWDLAKIKKAKQLSPILLVRGDFRTAIPLQIADGYHRVCASYHTDENTDIPVVLAVPD